MMAWTWQRTSLTLLVVVGLLLAGGAKADDEEEVTVTEEVVEKGEEVEDVIYTTPKQIENAHLMETFDDSVAFEKRWIRSQAKKEGVDDDIAKYNGVWELEESEKMPLIGDRGLLLKSKAKHAAISVPLKKTFNFVDKPLVVQYEVNLQNGQECGGAYIKLLTDQDGGVDLNNFNDKTPYTIMFGPDKCGNDYKLHFIFRHVNPLNGEIEEKHAKATNPRERIEEPFKDKKPHLFTLVVRPDNTYDISLDQEVVNTGSLLEDFSPPVNPPKEIDDPEDFMPKDWDEREKIPDPEATKPDDWDEDAPMQIPDPDAVKPKGWLDDEPEMVPDPTSEKPEDWDDEMDGEWEAALINNPKCAEAPGCGEWKAPVIDNPSYKGKWRPPMIDNPNYRGKWKPRTIPNPDYFEDLEPFKMRPIAAVGLELWSMSDNILFDNLLVTDNMADANQLAAETYDLKIMKLEKGQVGVFRRIINYSNKNPWLYGLYVLLVAIPVVLIFTCCCAETKESKNAKRKKTDEPTEDDPHAEEEEDAAAGKAGEESAENDAAAAASEESTENVDSDTAKDAKDEEEEEQKEEEDKDTKSDKEEESQPRTSPRLRKSRRE
ncbi:calnexin-like [Portunus trituberculatus]|uniref:calnexin-like n=1 Tax=Portunus trituberculatus TaxID=210409 RepID=UPI001E1CD15C|nr:calnexin-like [Portunus trituberculatus]